MADNVVIVGTRRGPSLVPAGELRQMAGRAGRIHGGPDARVDIIVPIEDAEYAMIALQEGDDPIIGSSMSDPDVMAFHLLPEICSGRVSDSQKAALWASRGFHAALGLPSALDDALAVLKDCGAVEEMSKRLMATQQGRIASAMYFHPADVEAWGSNFTEIFEQELEDDDLAAAWALGNVPIKRLSGDFGKKFWVVRNFQDELPPGLRVRDGSLLTCVLWWANLGGPGVGPMRGASLQLKDDRERVFGVLRRLDHEVMRWNKIDYFDRLEFQVKKGLSCHLVPLCRLPGVGKVLAGALYQMGIESPEDVVVEAGFDKLVSDEDIGMAARGMVDGFC